MSKALWRIILGLTFALALFWSFKGGRAYWNYQRLGPEVEAVVENIELVPKGSKYALRAFYSYKYGKKSFTGKTLFRKPYYLNRASAEAEVKKLSGMQWVAYVDSHHPKVSSLEKNFPLKELFYAFCSLGIFFYFVYLKFHVALLSKSI